MLPLNAVSKGAAKILAVSGLQIIFFASYSVFGVELVHFSYVYHFIILAFASRGFNGYLMRAWFSAMPYLYVNGVSQASQGFDAWEMLGI